MPSEFDLIRQYFTRPTPGAILGVGDDAALLQVSPGMELAVSVDMLVAGQHFGVADGPGTVGHKSLAVNLSDMAAMGAAPRWATLALALPAADEKWLRGFAGGFFGLAGKFGVELIGGDTTRGPLNICVQIMGEVPPGQALRRDGARAGDEIWVSGTLGNAALALAHYQRRVELEHREAAAMLPFLHLPQPRVAAGIALRGVASAAIDISDGLLADLGHILERSGLGAEIHFERLPLHAVMRRHIALEVAQNCVLAGGDDYELCFAAPAARHETILDLARQLELPLTCIGHMTAEAGLRLLRAGEIMTIGTKGFDHFAA
ncbi:MAG: thiamine-phosphate kinase [Sulfuricella sp.]|jgi:thiamine-monophosphate kinase|nr:thiamine-phosphate kinase [Sulfuricella sp.]